MATTEDLLRSDQAIRASADSLGAALASVTTYAPPALARAVQAEQNLYDRIDAESGLLSAGEAGRRLGSRSSAARNLAASTRRSGRLLAVRRGHHMLYPGFQFGEDGEPLSVLAALRATAKQFDQSEAGIVQWLCSPTTQLDGRRPVDLLRDAPDQVLDAANRSWGVDW